VLKEFETKTLKFISNRALLEYAIEIYKQGAY
jgi:hypothetical protein